MKLFINFKYQNISYGGGNQFVMGLINYVKTNSNIDIVFELDSDIDVYFLIDLRKDRHFKKYTFDEILQNKIKSNKGKIIYRINDTDITREVKSLEVLIEKHIDNIDYIVYNSTFVKNYYESKFSSFIIKQSSVIYNMVDSSYFYPKLDKQNCNSTIKIVTHHWSDNINKGYDYYYKLHQYIQTHNITDYKFVFIGRQFNTSFENPPQNIGPMCGLELGNALRDCDIYITASIYDSCPMHILEGLACGLPVLYLDHLGGVKDICEMGTNKIGESFNNFDELLEKLNMIIKNYNFYRQNVLHNLNLYNSNDCYRKYLEKIYSCVF